MHEKLKNIMREFVNNCNGICSTKNVNYLMHMIRSSNDNSKYLLDDCMLYVNKMCVYIAIVIDADEMYLIPLEDTKTAMNIIQLSGYSSVGTNISIMSYLYKKDKFNKSEQTVKYNGNSYAFIITDNIKDMYKTIFVIDKVSRRKIFAILDDTVWTNTIAIERFPYIKQYLAPGKIVDRSKNINIFPDCIKDKIISTKIADMLIQ